MGGGNINCPGQLAFTPASKHTKNVTKKVELTKQFNIDTQVGGGKLINYPLPSPLQAIHATNNTAEFDFNYVYN